VQKASKADRTRADVAYLADGSAPEPVLQRLVVHAETQAVTPAAEVQPV